MNRLFVARKPSGLSSNQYLGRLKRKYGVRKAGYSGTLDPFAKGVLIVAFGKYTSLFRFLAKTPKTYRATLWLGAHSDTLDIERVKQIDALLPLETEAVVAAVESLRGELTYAPPAYSAKRIDGQHAYDLARAGKAVALKPITSTIYEVRVLHYCHPFITFEATVSEGTYIRSLGALICERLGVEHGVLSMLERLREGHFVYEEERPLDIRRSLAIPQNRFTGDPRQIVLGQKLRREDFEQREDGVYWIDNGETLSVLRFDETGVHYELNGVAL